MLWAIIMAGGYGTRFWPESRKKNPKQFLRIFGSNTLLEQTIDRLKGVVPPARILVVTQQDKVSQCRKILRNIPPGNIFGEPEGRNTAPCAVLGAALALQKDPEAVIALLPADHFIKSPSLFRKALQAACETARKTSLPVTFGIKPAFAHTGYGYLEMSSRFASQRGMSVYRLKQFHEKPDFKKAQKFFKSKRFLWNSGMFLWRADSLLKATQKYLPKAYQLILRIVGGRDSFVRHCEEAAGRRGNLKVKIASVVSLPRNDSRFQNQMKRYYAEMPSISIDYGLMEKMRGKILTLPVDFGWNDVGGWLSLLDLHRQDSQGNVALGKSILLESQGNILKGNKKLIVLLGVKNHIIVDTPDALLVCPREKTESIRCIVQELEKKKLTKYL